MEILHLLQVEDSESDAALIVRLLEKGGYQVHARRVDDAASMRDALDSQAWDVIIADHRMGQFDAPSALRVLLATGRDIPFIVVSGSIGEETAVSLMKSGAHDYLLKDNLARLAPAVEREVREARSREDRRRAERSLRESEERMAAAVAATRLGTFDYHPQTGQVVWSEFTKSHFGLPADAEISTDTFFNAIHPDDRERMRTLLDQLLSPGSDGQYAAEYRIVGITDGVERLVSSCGRVYFDGAGRPVRFAGVLLDITERKRLQDQFLQAQKLESIGRLAGGIAHDFNNLLTIITGYTQLSLREMPAQHPVRERLDEISRAADMASDLTRQLLSFSRRQAIQPRKVALNDLIESLQKMLGRLIGEDVRLKVKLDPRVGSITADPGEIEQVIMNIAVNAKDAMPVGGTLSIETAPFVVREKSTGTLGRYVVLTISDTGVGIPPEAKAHLFEPFYTTKEPGKGTGLGLSTVYGIVTRCGGTIEVSSQLGQGTRVRIRLPAVEPESASVATAITWPAPQGSETILVVEDEAGVRRYVHDVLRDSGYNVLEAANGRQALEAVRQNASRIHLLLTDVVMPEMGGLELFRRFTELRPGTPVICMTGYTDSAIPEGEAPSGFLEKPFTPTALLSLVRSLLSTKTA